MTSVIDAAHRSGARVVLTVQSFAWSSTGLSRQKARYARALAAARLPYPALRERPTEEVIATLVTVPGIGRWTAEIYAIPVDAGVQEIVKSLAKHRIRRLLVKDGRKHVGLVSAMDVLVALAKD